MIDENLFWKGMHIYFDHWGIPLVQECKRKDGRRKNLDMICTILYEWWIRELDFDPRFDFSHKDFYSHFRKYRAVSVEKIPVQVKTKFIKHTMSDNIEGIISFQKNSTPNIQIVMINELAQKLFPSLTPNQPNYDLTPGDRWVQQYCRFVKLHPFISKHKLYKFNINELHQLTAILPLVSLHYPTCK